MTAADSGTADVAVVIPAYDAAATIDASLGSIAGQTVRPTEVIVVDDGSVDGTAALADRWAPILPVTVIRQANAGPAAARRRALQATSCSLIALLDADDAWTPDHLQLTVGAHRRHGGIISPNGWRWSPGSDVEPRRHQDLLPVPPPERQRTAILRKNFVFISALFGREECEAVGGFRDGFTAAEDWDLWIRMIRAGAAVHALSRPTCLYRVAGGGLTWSDQVYRSYIAVLEAAAREAGPDDQAAIKRSLHWYRHRSALAAALAAARRGSTAEARRLALGSLTGSPSMAAQSAGLLVAPTRTTTWRDRRRARIL